MIFILPESERAYTISYFPFVIIINLGPILHCLATIQPWPTDERTDNRRIVHVRDYSRSLLLGDKVPFHRPQQTRVETAKSMWKWGQGAWGMNQIRVLFLTEMYGRKYKFWTGFDSTGSNLVVLSRK